MRRQRGIRFSSDLILKRSPAYPEIAYGNPVVSLLLRNMMKWFIEVFCATSSGNARRKVRWLDSEINQARKSIAIAD